MVGIIIAARQVSVILVGRFMAQPGFFGNLFQSQTLNAGWCVDKIFLYKLLLEPHRLKNLGAVIAFHSRDAHLRHNCQNAADSRFHIIILGLFPVQSRQKFPFRRQGFYRIQSQIRIDGRNAVTNQGAEVMSLTGFPGFQYQAHVRTHRLFNQVIMYRRRSQQGRHRRHPGINSPVR